MTQAIFPLLGTVLLVLLVLPLSALVAKTVLLFLERDEAGGPLHGLNARYVLLTGSSLFPLAWFLSAGIHQVETDQPTQVCLFSHQAAICFEPGLFALAIALATFGSWVRVRRSSLDASPSNSLRAQKLLARLDTLVLARPELLFLSGRLRVTEDPSFSLGTQGLLRPFVSVGAAYAERLTDELLASALNHEGEHVRTFDPLRYLLLALALAVNPLGRWLLDPHAVRWLTAREAHCDREAVLHGAPPLALAEAIVQAARPSFRQAIALGARDLATLKLRVGMLFAFEEQTPSRCCHQGLAAIPAGLLLLLLALLLPHRTGTGALDALHTGAEFGIAHFWR